MKESKVIIIVLIALMIIIHPAILILKFTAPDIIDFYGVETNLYCGIIVGLITSICQYYVARRKIVTAVYNAYFDIYKSYFYSKNNTFLGHYNSYDLSKKLIELNPKIIEALDEYDGLFKKYDKTYKKLNPKVNIIENYKLKHLKKTIYKCFNKKEFYLYFEPFMKNIEDILININKDRFKKDQDNMIRMYNYIFDSNQKRN